MNILVINAGSSSLKYQLINMANTEVKAEGIAERIGTKGSLLKHKPTGFEKVLIEKPMKTHTDAIELVISELTGSEHGVIAGMDEINAVGHRVVHGAELFSGSVVIDDEVVAAIEKCAELAPLHNPANLMGINACKQIMPNVPMVAVFDTAFHQTMEQDAYLYGLSYEAYKKYGIRRYGFHGTSHKFVANRYAELTGKKVEDLKLVTCHLGNGSSVCAVDGGKSVDTSMGFTPLEGLVMGTRSGDIDPAIVPYLMDKMGMSLEETITYLNKECGVWGLSGVSSDFRDLWTAQQEGSERAETALKVFCRKLKKTIGSYVAIMGGVDAIIFTAGIGENDHKVREWSVEGLQFIGAHLNYEYNAANEHVFGKDMKFSTDESTVEIWCIPTNEELAIAKETFRLCK